MEKDLPNIFKGEVNESNNQDKSILGEEVKEEITKPKRSIDNQIKEIFNSTSFLYKADVLITMNDGSSTKKTIIGRSNNSLITIDDELIDVKNISRIELI